MIARNNRNVGSHSFEFLTWAEQPTAAVDRARRLNTAQAVGKFATIGTRTPGGRDSIHLGRADLVRHRIALAETKDLRRALLRKLLYGSSSCRNLRPANFQEGSGVSLTLSQKN